MSHGLPTLSSLGSQSGWDSTWVRKCFEWNQNYNTLKQKTSLLASQMDTMVICVCVCFLFWLFLCLNDFLFVVGSLFWFLVFWSFWFSSLNFLSLFWENRKENVKLGRKERKYERIWPVERRDQDILHGKILNTYFNAKTSIWADIDQTQKKTNI